MYTVTLSGLVPDTLYTCCLLLRDEVLGSSVQQCQNIQQPAVPSTTTPTIQSAVSSVATPTIQSAVLSTTTPTIQSAVPSTTTPTVVQSAVPSIDTQRIQAVQGFSSVGWAVGIIIGLVVGAGGTALVLLVVVIVAKKREKEKTALFTVNSK